MQLLINLLFPPPPLFPTHQPRLQINPQKFTHKPHSPSPHFPTLPPFSSASSLRPLAGADQTHQSPNDELSRLLLLLPPELRLRIQNHPEHYHLIEIVMDLGRRPLARFPSGDFVLSDRLIGIEDIVDATSRVGDFGADNRAGISRTLHRISCIRNRKGVIIGLTCRVGRAVAGSANLLRDLVKDGGSLLLIGPPGVGKTTIIREIARILADDFKKRVMIVDTSNEIGGDGDVPHPGIGSARRLQVPNSDMQHKVLIEAVENHMPQVIVIDEIGTKLEALAASTIAQRGIQLVATAHGVTMQNLIMNPSLNILVGGVQIFPVGDGFQPNPTLGATSSLSLICRIPTTRQQVFGKRCVDSCILDLLPIRGTTERMGGGYIPSQTLSAMLPFIVVATNVLVHLIFCF